MRYPKSRKNKTLFIQKTHLISENKDFKEGLDK